MNNVSSFEPEISYKRVFEGLNEDAEYQQERLMIQFTEEVCRILRDQGLSTQDVAEDCGMDTHRLKYIFERIDSPTFEEIATILAYLGVEPELKLWSPEDES